MEIKGRVALITGAASGIGKAYAVELLNQGAKVAICDINTEEGEKLVETLAAKYGKDRVIFSQCDVTDYPQFEESFQTTIAEFGHIDIVINNAGIMNDRFWELEVDINLNGVIRGTLLAQRFMGTDRGGQGGVVINTGSNTSINPYVSVPIYSATKAAIVSFTRAFGDQYHVDLTGVKVMALCPGATDTKLVRDVNRKLLLARYEDAWQKDMVSSIPQRAEHVAKALVNVLSTGKSGSVWMVEKDQPPHEISFTKHFWSVIGAKIMKIQGKTVLITGGANGIGYCTARELLQSGAKAIAIVDLPDSNGESAVAELEKEFGAGHAFFLVGNVANAKQLAGCFKKAIESFGTLDIVINNAGVMNDAEWEPMVDINYKGVVSGTILGLNHMGRHKGGKGGTIVNMSSIVGLQGNPLAPIYAGTHFAVVGFTSSLVTFYDKTGVRVLIICPGLTTTGLASKFMSSKVYAMDLLDDEIAANEMTTMESQSPEHVASAIVELIEKGKNGAVFVSENNQPAYAVKLPSYPDLKISV
ncbi:PREDICTED: peroxisomal hydratase-dehydrogenase-epimerase-like [Vollenhovia emeryi]|uniref:peroxisomal hydratase-dehydrogenase-epimerase-like n=1 Tax=Vollenhovia emeryi TaxID=411798 RepID=UPI0005F55F5E|nr:PREDICTED: peroxisomal hydratase-dehydrogenase-epimerase-like [Vollenhovia emeryi]